MLGLIASILEIFSDLALDIQEFFFRKKREKRRAFERENNLPKKRMISPYERFYIILGLLFLATLIFSFLFNLTSSTTKKDENLAEIKELLKKEKEVFGVYPKELKTIIRNNPLRANLLEDRFGKDFNYEQTDNGKSYVLFSLGKDGKLYTEDDIK